MDAFVKFVYRKETLLWTPLILDVSLAFMTYPVFYTMGPRAMAQALKLNEEETREFESNKQTKTIWELAMVAYTGYFALLLSSTYCCYRYPETRKVTGLAMFALILEKVVSLNKKGLMMEESNPEMQAGKTGTLYFFYVPFYGTYCLLNAYEWYQAAKAK
mmetsp:Transcript_44457/g.71208  ORF Transcript_44457/g.71208 Transcript_44457/m.71208 type:complete len:160 (+) Transcript_44457:24-503(+)|eukprot:CAMPEP_0197045310 /NCGR_PEP_ID=MMETSP1384-20130603/21196_1 /TAXON_ID=29189 /ORGANISM="Ammonia sp." /LENGTH=159 /DNA_ID=CAMNT_0042476903 /DNA_START=23 /DNA_END=502 /DNA_ORIENTATION=-